MRPTWRNCLIFIGVLAAQIVCGLGCDDDRSIRRYQTAKETPTPASPFGASDSAAMPAVKLDLPASVLAWKLPAGWKRVPIPSDPDAQRMEFARFSVSADSPGTVLTADPMTGDGGGIVMNVQRWEGQLKLPISQTPEEIDALVQPLNTPIGQADVLDISSPPGSADPQRLIGAILPHEHDGLTWFLTLKGPKKVIDGQRGNFEAFILSLTFPDDPESTMGPGAIAPTTEPDASVGTGGIASYRAPADWKPAAPANNGIRVLGFDSGPVLITAEKLHHEDGLQPLTIVNKWRSEVGLPGLTDERAIQPLAFPVDGHNGFMFDLQGPVEKGGKRLIVATTRVGDEDWYFKIIGPSDAVAGEFPAFLPFLQSIHFAGDDSGAVGGGK